jgi:hypothetical protein
MSLDPTSRGHIHDADFTYSMGNEGLISKENKAAILKFIDEDLHRDAVGAKTVRNSLANADHGQLGSTMSLADAETLKDQIRRILTPGWMIWAFGNWTTWIVGGLTFFMVFTSIARSLLRFGSEMLIHGWDGGRTMWRCLKGFCGIITVPMKMFQALRMLDQPEMNELVQHRGQDAVEAWNAALAVEAIRRAALATEAVVAAGAAAHRVALEEELDKQPSAPPPMYPDTRK